MRNNVLVNSGILNSKFSYLYTPVTICDFFQLRIFVVYAIYCNYEFQIFARSYVEKSFIDVIHLRIFVQKGLLSIVCLDRQVFSRLFYSSSIILNKNLFKQNYFFCLLLSCITRNAIEPLNPLMSGRIPGENYSSSTIQYKRRNKNFQLDLQAELRIAHRSNEFETRFP